MIEPSPSHQLQKRCASSKTILTKPGSEIQEDMLRWLCSRDGAQIAGYGMGKWLSACNALKRRGLAINYINRCGWYCATDLGREWVKNNPRMVKDSDVKAAIATTKKHGPALKVVKE